MFRSFLSCLVYFGIAMAVDDDPTMIPVCENKSPNDVHFDLSKMGLNAIRKPFVSGPSVTCINLAGNRITEIEHGAFDGLPELNYLNLAMNPVSFEDFMNNVNLPRLRGLVLDGPFVDEYRRSYDNQEHNPSSDYYTSYYHKDRLSNVLPISLPSLEKLSIRNFGNNPVSTWLDYFIVPNLTHLYIAGNSFTEGYLPQILMENLTHLNIDDNQIRIFATNFPKLRHLSMNRNQIGNICNQNCNYNSLSVRDMPQLEYLSLVDNEITSIEPDAFEDSESLRFINLTSNKIKFLPRHLLKMANLKHLSLANNELTEIPDICGLRELEALVLRGNMISAIDATSFCNLSKLRSIDLSQNGLTIVSSGTFSELSGLTTLNLSQNQIQALPENWMGAGHALGTLNLDGNLFNDIANMSLGLIEKLDTISIGQNPLRTVMIRSLMTLPPDMKIDVSRVYNSP